MIAEFIKVESNISVRTGVNIGGLQLEKMDTVLPYSASVVANNQEIVKITGQVEKQSFDLSVQFPDETVKVTMFGGSNTIAQAGQVLNIIANTVKGNGNALVETMVPKLFDQAGNQINTVEPLMGGSGSQMYSYMKQTVKGVELTSYMVPMGKDGINYCFYNNNQTVGIIRKSNVVRNGKYTYTIYVQDEKWFRYVLLAGIGYMISFENDSLNSNIGMRTNTISSTANQELISKYDPNFIAMVEGAASPESLPQNMQLANQLKKDAQNTPFVKANRIGFFILFGVIIVIFAICVIVNQ